MIAPVIYITASKMYIIIFTFHFPKILVSFYFFFLNQANRWCAEGVDLLASQQLEKCSSPEFALRALTDIEDFLASAKEYRDPNQVRALFQDVLTPETKSLIHQVLT